MNLKKNWLIYFISFVAAIVFFQINFGLNVVLPTNISWLMTIKTDWNTHYLGWFFYRNEPWQFPLGKVSGYYYPIGTNVGFTDSIPLMAIFFKLFSHILPADFQYFGFWLLLCRLLIAYFTIRICKLYSIKNFYIFLAVIFMIQNPVLLYRSMHPALCAHWLFLASGYLYLLDPSRVPPAKIFRRQLVLLLLSAIITPYLLIIEFGFTLILYWRHLAYDNSVDWKFVVRDLGISGISGAAIWWLCGMITFGKKEHLAINGGFGKLSMNLNAFFDPWGWSSLLHPMKRISIMQYEGFMYLGVGVFFLILVALIYRFGRITQKGASTPPLAMMSPAPHPPAVPLLAFCALLGFAAVTNVVTFNDKVLFTIPVPAIVTNTGDIFRASGRLFWPVYYLILFALVIYLARSKWPEWLKTTVLTLGLLIQLYDIKLLITFQKPSYGTYQPPVSQQWHEVMRPFDKILFYPPFLTDYLGVQDYEYFSFIAAQERKPIDVGYVARADYSAMQQYTDSMKIGLQLGHVDSAALYITTPAQVDQFLPSLQRHALTLHRLDGYYYFYAPGGAHNAIGTDDSATARIQDSLVAAFNAGKKQFEPGPVPGTQNDSIKINVESAVSVPGYLSLSGWCFIQGERNDKGDSLYALLLGNGKCYRSPMAIVPRPDITAYFKGEYLDDAGFKADLFEEKVEKGVYRLAIAIKKKEGQWFYKSSDKRLIVGGGN